MAKNTTTIKRHLLNRFDANYLRNNSNENRQILNTVGKVNVGWNKEYLSSLGNFKTIIDVGAANDFHDLHESVHNSVSILIDANENYIPEYKRYLSKKEGEYHIALLSDKVENKNYYLNVDKPYTSSVYNKSDKIKTKEYHFKTKTLDTLIDLDKLSGRNLLKLDVEGSEVPILRGAKKLLSKIDMVLCECSLDPEFAGGDNFNDIYSSLIKIGFSIKDIIRVPRVNFNTYPCQVIDVVFAK